MADLLRRFEDPVVDSDGETYTVSVYGRSRPGNTWQGWIVFERASDSHRLATGVETTQSNAEDIVYWATGLGRAYFDGALRRARLRENPQPRLAAPIRPVVTRGTDASSRTETLATIQEEIFAIFRMTDQTHLLTAAVLDALQRSHADTVRAIEDLEKRRRAVVRRTEQGNDWLFLTAYGMQLAGLEERPHSSEHAPDQSGVALNVTGRDATRGREPGAR
ncbi:MAG TPA: hypothetical protein VF057_05350 [Thermoanaerobaculia bacterium]